MDMSGIPTEVRTVWNALDAKGPTYLVGGAVRDLLRESAVHDWDLATSLSPDDVITWGHSAGYRVVPTGLDFGTVTIITGTGPVEVTTFRRDGRYLDGRHPASVSFAATIDEDLARRDFTINAMALGTDGALIDPFGGASDLTRCRITTVGTPEERFKEDPLRMLRAVRLIGLKSADSHPFTLDPLVYETLSRLKPLIANVSAERLRLELMKLLGQPHAAEALAWFSKSGLLGVLWPEWVATQTFDQHNPHHRYPVDEHLLRTAAVGPTPFLRLVGLLHDIAKPSCFWQSEDGVGHFHNHDHVGAKYTRHILQRMRFDNATVERAATLVEHHLFPWDVAKDKAIRRTIRELGEGTVLELLELRRMDVIGAGYRWDAETAVKSRVQHLMEEAPAERRLAVNGRDIMQVAGLSPGPAVGAFLRRLQDWVDEDPRRNTREALVEQMARWLVEGQDSLPKKPR